MTKQQADELAALKARIEELERANKPPKPFTERPWQRHDPTANMTMPVSAMLEMARAVPTEMVRGIVRDNQGPQGPSSAGIVPSSQQLTSVRPAGGGTGWQNPAPLSNPPGIRMVDALCIADDVKRRSKSKS
jgi:hypothetical protein